MFHAQVCYFFNPNIYWQSFWFLANPFWSTIITIYAILYIWQRKEQAFLNAWKLTSTLCHTSHVTKLNKTKLKIKIMDFLVTTLRNLDLKQDHLEECQWKANNYHSITVINLEYIQPIIFKLYETIHSHIISVSYITRKNCIINN